MISSLGQQIRTEIVQNCIKAESLLEAKRAHDDILKENSSPDLFLQNTLINMYVRCGSLNDAIDVFKGMSERNVFSCTLMLSGYEKYGRPEEAIRLFWQIEEQGISVDNVAFVTALKACTKALNLEQGKHIHSHILVLGMDINTFVYNALVDMYSKCGSMIDAVHVFDQMDGRDAVSFNAIISACVQSGNDAIALTFFNRMTSEGLRPDEVTFLCILKACAVLGSYETGKEVHGQVLERGLSEKDVVLCTALVDMYAKCGALERAHEVFDLIPLQSVVSWNALMSGYAQLGDAQKVFDVFNKMIEEQGTAMPDSVTFLNLLNVSCHDGLVKEGKRMLSNMEKVYFLTPEVEHYTCMVDLYGRAGQVEQTISVIKDMPFHADLSIWNTLLGACQKWGNVQLGVLAFEHVIQLDEKDVVAYVSLSNIFAASGKQGDSEKIKAILGNKRIS